MTPVPALADRWRSEAERLRHFGADLQARTLETCAAELEAETRAEQLRLVTLREAAELSGYSYSALEKGVRAGRLPNAGTKHSPRIRVENLPRKGGTKIAAVAEPDLAELVLAARR